MWPAMRSRAARMESSVTVKLFLPAMDCEQRQFCTGLERNAHFNALRNGFHDLHDPMAWVDLLAQPHQPKLFELVYVARNRATVSAQFGSKRRNAQTLLPHRLTKPD